MPTETYASDLAGPPVAGAGEEPLVDSVVDATSGHFFVITCLDVVIPV